MQSAAIDIFSYIVEYSPSMVREFIKQESQRQDDVCIKLLLFLTWLNSIADLTLHDEI